MVELESILIPLLQIIIIDLVLGGDNAIVIALACRNLPESRRNKAIVLGTGLAIIVRVVLTIVAVVLLKIPFLMLFGGIMLTFIAYNLLTDSKADTDIQGGTTLMEAIRTIVVADLVMGFDNVIGIAGAAHGSIILVITGLLVSVPIIIWGSKVILYFMERYPSIIYIGAGILAFTAAGMITGEQIIQYWIGNDLKKEMLIYLLIIGGVLILGSITRRGRTRTNI